MYTGAHIAARITRGGGTGPLKPRQPPARERCQFHQAPTTSLGDVEAAVSLDLRPQTPAEAFSHMPPESLSCKECRTTYPLEARYVCERCFGPLEVSYASRSEADPAALRRRTRRAARLAERLGLGEVWIKNDAANPTHSFKDRVVSVALARARELGFQTIACASTGKLANAVAAP